VRFEFGQDRLAEPRPLNPFELAQSAIKVLLEARIIAEQGVELRGERKLLPKRFQVHPLGFHRCASYLVALELLPIDISKPYVNRGGAPVATQAPCGLEKNALS